MANNWSDLPTDLIEQVTNLLALSDLHRFSAVCRTWRGVAKEKSHTPRKEIPWLVLGEDTATQKRQFFNLSENRHYYIDIPELRGQYLIGSSHGWLFIIGTDLKFRMINPFRGECYDLPPLPQCRCCGLLLTCSCEKLYDGWTPPHIFLQHRFVRKAILDQDPSRCSDFKVLIVYGFFHLRLAFWMPSRLDWTKITSFYRLPTFDDLIFFKGVFYVISRSFTNIYMVVDDIAGANPRPRLAIVKSCLLSSSYHPSSKYLVDFMGSDLLILERHKAIVQEDHQVTVRFHVYRFDLEKKELSKCNHISDFALFVGNNSAVVIDPSQFPGCKKNAIYYTDVAGSFTYRYGWDDLGIYNITTDTCTRYYPQNIYHPNFATPTWLNPNP